MAAPSEPGVRQCICCGWLFVTPDWERIRRCADCKHNEDTFELPVARFGERDGERPRPACVRDF